MKFYLGTHMPSWLYKYDTPFFVSHRRLKDRKRLKPAKGEWCLDSGGFTELSMYGRWETSTDDYIAAVRRYNDNIGGLQWAAPQDAMCEPWILEKSKAWLGGTVLAHQRWTIDNYLTLRHKADDLPFVPVLQGWELDDYLRMVDMYDKAGIDLTAAKTVGIGSVCRRQATSEIAAIISRLYAFDLKMHGFGVKAKGIDQYGWMLHSADSMAWCYRGQYSRPCPIYGHATCSNCHHFAMEWRDRVLAATNSRGVQLSMSF
jgi:hypothetical protein